MYYLIDKTLLFLIGFSLLLVGGVENEMGVSIIVASLLALLFMAFDSYFEEFAMEKRKKIMLISGSVFLVVSVLCPTVSCFTTIVVYDIICVEYNFLAIVFVLLEGSLVFDTFVLDGVAGVANVTLISSNINCFILYVISVGLMVYLQKKSVRLETLEKNIKQIRDDSEEKRLLEEKKNRRILETQDQEIYVATLKERNRIAREIHDHVGHIITRTLLQMGALMTIHKEEPLHGQLDAVKENLDMAMNNIRNSVHDLHDESVDLEQAIRDIVESGNEKFQCKYEYDFSKSVAKDCKYAIIAIVKEAVNNALKYSNNDRLDVILREHPAMYQVVIHDYSRSNLEDRSSTQENKKMNNLYEGKSGIGLQNIRDRVEQLNGHLVISNSNGFKIFATIPKNRDKH